MLLLRSIEDSVKSRVRVLFKSTLSDRILSIAGTSRNCIRIFDRGSLVLRQFRSVLIGNPKYKYGDGRGNNGMLVYSRVVPDFEAVCMSCLQQQHSIDNSDEGTVDAP